jgi:hypothetical protein
MPVSETVGRRGRRAQRSAKLLGTSRRARPKPFLFRWKTSRPTTKFSDRTPAHQHAGARQQAAREARSPAAEHFMVMRLAATPS